MRYLLSHGRGSQPRTVRTFRALPLGRWLDVSGQFFASAPKKLTGPIEAMRHPHFHDRANQEAAWQAVVKVSGVDFSSATPLSAAS